MPLEKDVQGRRLRINLELPGTPEQVWQALATGPGHATWFVPAEIEERVGGTVTFRFAPGVTSSGRVTEWQPPRRFAYEEPGWSHGAPPLATEIVIEARSGGTCTVRIVHSLFTSKGDWDDELEGFERDLSSPLRVLKLYLAHFAGEHAATARSSRSFDGTLERAWLAMREHLGLSTACVGAVFRAPLDGASPMAGVLEHLEDAPTSRSLTLRLERPMAGIAVIDARARGDRITVARTLRLYGGNADEVIVQEQAAWESWLEDSVGRGPTDR